MSTNKLKEINVGDVEVHDQVLINGDRYIRLNTAYPDQLINNIISDYLSTIDGKRINSEQLNVVMEISKVIGL